MSRTLVIVAGAVALLAAGGAGVWWYNKSTAESEILLALDRLEDAGLETEFQSLEVSGFPVSYTGDFTGLVVRSRAHGVEVSLPTASAGMSLTDIGTVVFTLPETFSMRRLNAEGVLVGDPLVVTSENLISEVGAKDEQTYEVSVRADRVRAEPEGGAGDHVETVGFAASADVEVGSTPDTASITASYAADSFSSQFAALGPAGGAQTALGSFEGMSGDVKADETQILVRLNADRMAASANSDGVEEPTLDQPNVTFDVAVEGFSTTALTTPDGPLSLMDVLAQGGEGNALSALVNASLKAVARGGEFDGDTAFDSLAGSMAVDNGAGDATTISFSGSALTNTVDAGPENLGYTFGGETLAFETVNTDPTQGGGLTYELGGFGVSASVVPSERFDFSASVDAATPDAAADLVAREIRDEIVAGGAATFEVEADTVGMVLDLNDPTQPFSSLAYGVGRNTTLFKLSADVVETEALAVDYVISLAGQVNGQVGVRETTFRGDFPVDASEDPQPATMFLDLNMIAVDDALWSLFDPENQMPRDIRGVLIDATADLQVGENLLAIDVDPAVPYVPDVEFASFTLNRALLDLVGMTAEAEGQIERSPFGPSGAIEVLLTNWRGALDNFSKTPFGQSPQSGMAMIMISGWLDSFGEPGEAENTTRLNLEFADGGLTINGQPFQGFGPGAPAPAPAPVPEDAPNLDAPPIPPVSPEVLPPIEAPANPQ